MYVGDDSDNEDDEFEDVVEDMFFIYHRIAELS